MQRPSAKFRNSNNRAYDITELEFDIAGRLFQFDADIFKLDEHNIGILNSQITQIPGWAAYIGSAVAAAERWLAKTQLAFDVWRSQKLVSYFGDNRVYKSETDKMNNLIKNFAKEYSDYQDTIDEIKRIHKILKSYERAMDAKVQLAQTLSANIRIERDSLARDYDKSNNKSSAVGRL